MSRSVSAGIRAAALILAAALCGVAALYAGSNGHWGLLFGSVLCVGLLCVAGWNVASRHFSSSNGYPVGNDRRAPDDRMVVDRLLLDAVPTPLVMIANGVPSALNRAARNLFSTDDRILPIPTELVDPGIDQFTFSNRIWRIDRVVADERASQLTVAALIDFEKDRLAAEVVASGELIEVLSHELMNGLAPIVSLSESAQSVAQSDPIQPDLLLEVLGPLTRRAESLHRFAANYHSLARLPKPSPQSVKIDTFLSDIEKAFTKTWPGIELVIDKSNGAIAWFDPDLIHQVVWALLQNAAEALASHADRRIKIGFSKSDHDFGLSIEDNGMGVPAEAAAFVFRPFFTTKDSGSGIGLALSRQIVRAHGGSLSLASLNPAQFALSLPLTDTGQSNDAH